MGDITHINEAFLNFSPNLTPTYSIEYLDFVSPDIYTDFVSPYI